MSKLHAIKSTDETPVEADAEARPVQTDARTHTRLGWWIIIVGIGGFLLWASLAPLDKGVPLSGTVTVASSKKEVQHLTGGIVDAILVKEGDFVKAGDVLVRMNSVQANANAEMTRAQYLTSRATEARLIAERDGARSITFAPELASAKNDPRVANNIAVQLQLFNSRRSALNSELAGLDENIAGLTLQIQGLEESREGKKLQLQFMKEQLDGMRDLAHDGYVARNRLLELERSYAQINASIAEDLGNIGRGQRQIAELKLRRLQRRQEYQKEVRSQLAEVQKEADSLSNRLTALEYDLANILVKAPVAGTVVDLSISTQGGVISPGFNILDIVPSDDPLIVEGQVPVHLIDKVRVNLPIELIFTAFHQNMTPHVPGMVTHVSADRLVDPKTGQPFYKMRAQVAPEGMKIISTLQIRPGMPVDLFVKTGERTMMNYLLKPLLDHWKMAMTEE